MRNLSMLLILMVAVICASLKDKCDLMHEICEETENVRKNMTKEKLKTRMTVAEAEIKCSNKFFCKVEKSLNATQLPGLQKLKNLLNQYNKCPQSTTNCALNSNISDTLDVFLKEITDCTRFNNVFRKCAHTNHTKHTKHGKA